MKTLLIAAALALTLCWSTASANSLKTVKITDRVYALVGDLGNRSPENLGNNATFGVVITDAGVVLIDPGGSRRGAAMIDAAIGRLTDQPVALAINTGGQDHRWMGNGYFKEQGARIVANRRAVEDQRARASEQLSMLAMLIGTENLRGTAPVYADETFDEALVLDVGGVRFELRHAARAHTPGDSFVWLPDEGVVFTGDIVYVERMLGVLPVSSSREWLEAFAAIAALEPAVVVPGHGDPTDLARATADTYDYLVFLREAVGEFMDHGGDITRVGTLDQSRFSYLENYDTLKGRNAQQVFQQMEWE
jgi:glyoxylase-like metal-dependent hydrolase (beta-lactamase superfamily II)